MSDVKTVFGSLGEFQKGRIEVINDDPRNYVFSNVFEVASRAQPYERIAVGKNFEYVIECLRAEGASPWYTCAHDEFALVMDGTVEVHLVKIDDPRIVSAEKSGAVLIAGEPKGRKMGSVTAGRGHMTLLPKGAAYQFRAAKPGVVTIQTMQGDLTQERWADICLK